MKFDELGIRPELTSSLNKMDFFNPTEVQEKTIPLILNGQDLTVRSKTGSGKTGAFLIPLINNMGKNNLLETIVIVPTRELALQVSEVAKRIGSVYKKRVTTVYGGASMVVQINSLRNGSNIIVGTPGRILDLIERGELNLKSIRYVVLDEADIMLDMGFIDDIELILSHTPKSRQTLLFSATMPSEIMELAAKHMRRDLRNIRIGAEDKEIVENVSHLYGVVEQDNKFAMLMAYFQQYKPRKSIIFTNTKRMADIIADTMRNNGLSVSLLHGGKSQAERERALDSFKNGQDILVATNVAARGLDIPEVTDIINYDAPDDPVAYIHRVGRSARMGKEGRAFTIINDTQKTLIMEIKKRTKIDISRIQVNIDQFRDTKIPYNWHSNIERGNRDHESRGRNNRTKGKGRYSYRVGGPHPRW